MKEYKPYSPITQEQEIYQKWVDSGFFNPDKCVEQGLTSPDAEPFSIVLPPPNVTGTLHTGHALMLVVEDIFVRFARMMGKKTLWIPGTDHAAIATQSKVEKQVVKSGSSRHILGRENFLNKVHKFAAESHDIIVGQMRKMGASVDWSREAFTLDEPRSKAVFTAFQTLYDKGLIYRGNRVINWDVKGQTTISDDELVYVERKSTLYTFRYSKDFPIEISTTRPETKLGDTAVCVNPSDLRYAEFIGKEFDIDFLGHPLKIRIIADHTVDKDFGTGALGVTPAHSMIDYQLSLKHDLPIIQVIDEVGKICREGQFLGQKVVIARENIVNLLREKGLISSEEEIEQNVATAERTGGVIEPLPKMQWFVDVNKSFILEHSSITGIDSGSEVTLKKLMAHAVDSKQVEIMPERFVKVYSQWVENLRDWCISRQIWYGHRIPVWYSGEEVKVSQTSPGEGWIQDEDTLDTWFSSGLWTFSTLGWPDLTADFKTYHPTTILETGSDILSMWVARMILMSSALLGEYPFKTVYFHGIVRDEKGRKMSKSLENAVNPVDLIDKYGADALRFAMIFGTSLGNDQNISDQKVKGMRNFANKVYNISRFIILNSEHLTENTSNISPEVKDIHSKYIADLSNFLIIEQANILYDYIWHKLADIRLEEQKLLLASGDKTSFYLFKNDFILLIKLLHPYMPFVTEKVYQDFTEAKIIQNPKPFLMVESLI